jgi:outer membrane protein TolC
MAGTLLAVPAMAALAGWTLSGPAQAQNASPPAPSGEVLTLDQAIDLALQNNRGIQNARIAVAQTGDQVAAARTARLPSLRLFSLLSQGLIENKVKVNNPARGLLPGVGDFFLTTTDKRFTTAVAPLLVLPLTQQHRIGLNIDLAKLDRRLAQEKLRSDRQALVAEVKRSYYGILHTESALDSVREALTSYHELDRVTGELLVKGVALKADQLQVQTHLAKAEFEQVDLGNQLATQQEQLNSLLGRDVLTSFRVLAVPEATFADVDLTAARRRALAQRPEVRQARLKIQQARDERGIRKSEYIPDVSLGATYLGLHNFQNVVPENTASVGVAVNWEIWDWGRRRDEVAVASKAIEQAQNGLRDVEDQVLIDVSDTLRKLAQSRLALRESQLGQETARQVLQDTSSRYRTQAAVLSDVLQSQASLADANDQYEQALLGFWTAKAEFERALGEER